MEIDVLDGMCVVVAAKVAFRNLRQSQSGSVVSKIDWDECGLRRPSYALIDQKLELSSESLLRSQPIGGPLDARMRVTSSI